MTAAKRSVDLAAYPDLVMILLGFRIGSLRGLRAFFSLGEGMRGIERDPPEGLLSHERFMFGWRHIGIRQYWRDFDALERFTRAGPHAEWWRRFARDAGGAGFWHETYCARGGVEAVYMDMPPVGLSRFAPARPAAGPFATARGRLAVHASQSAA